MPIHVDVPGHGIVEFPDGMTDDQIASAIKANMHQQQPEPSLIERAENNLKNFYTKDAPQIAMGALKGASDIGTTLLAPVDYLNDKITGKSGSHDARKEAIKGFFKENSDPSSGAFKLGDISAGIAGTAGAGGLIGKGMQAIPSMAKYAPLVASGGFNMGNAGTGSKMADLLLRAGGGAVQGGAQAGLINPDSAGTGAMIGALAPGVVQGAGYLGDAVSKGADNAAQGLMMSALKPTLKQHQTGKAAIAARTLLDEGINATPGGVEQLKSRIGEVNNQISDLISNSPATVDKRSVIQALADTRNKFGSQVSPTADLNAIQGVEDDFLAHPVATGNDIPVSLAQQLKQGTYRVLSNKYGQLGSAETEAQKALARGLKDQIANAVPEVAGLNARESKLISTLDVAERRALMDLNKNPGGLALLAGNKAAFAAFLADKSALFKSLAARMANTAAQGLDQPLLPDLVKKYGLLGAPSVAGTTSP